jgi:hypothetical protein
MRDRFVCGRGVTAAPRVSGPDVRPVPACGSPLYAQGTTPTVTVGGGVQASYVHTSPDEGDALTNSR